MQYALFSRLKRFFLFFFAIYFNRLRARNCALIVWEFVGEFVGEENARFVRAC